jgi:hypothetical protein
MAKTLGKGLRITFKTANMDNFFLRELWVLMAKYCLPELIGSKG